MTETQSPLPELQRILWSARIDAASNRWHLTNRVIPPLRKLAGATDDPQLSQAVAHTTAAVEHTDALLEELRTAIDLFQV